MDAQFDTDILLDALRDVKAAQSELLRYRKRYISRLTWHEIFTQSLPDRSEQGEGFLGHFMIVELNEEIARRAATLRSQTPGLDLHAAINLASAQDGGRIFVSRNDKIFSPAMPGIRIAYTLTD